MANFSELVKSHPLVLVDFSADWCGPCKMLAPILKEVKNQTGDAVRILKIDVDKNQQLASILKIRSVPTLILFKSGEKVWRESGAFPLKQLISIAQKHIN